MWNSWCEIELTNGKLMFSLREERTQAAFFLTGNLGEEIHLQMCAFWILQFSSRKKTQSAIPVRNLFQNITRNLLVVVEISCYADRTMKRGSPSASKLMLCNYL